VADAVGPKRYGPERGDRAHHAVSAGHD
jgi:hypothetical protein